MAGIPLALTVLAVPQVRVAARWISCSRAASIEMWWVTGVAGAAGHGRHPDARADWQTSLPRNGGGHHASRGQPGRLPAVQEMSCMSYRVNRPAVAGVILAVAAGLAAGGCSSSATSSVVSCSAEHAAAGQASNTPPGSPNPAVAAGWTLPGG